MAFICRLASLFCRNIRKDFIQPAINLLHIAHGANFCFSRFDEAPLR